MKRLDEDSEENQEVVFQQKSGIKNQSGQQQQNIYQMSPSKVKSLDSPEVDRIFQSSPSKAPLDQPDFFVQKEDIQEELPRMSPVQLNRSMQNSGMQQQQQSIQQSLRPVSLPQQAIDATQTAFEPIPFTLQYPKSLIQKLVAVEIMVVSALQATALMMFVFGQRILIQNFFFGFTFGLLDLLTFTSPLRPEWFVRTVQKYFRIILRSGGCFSFQGLICFVYPYVFDTTVNVVRSSFMVVCSFLVAAGVSMMVVEERCFGAVVVGGGGASGKVQGQVQVQGQKK